MGSAILWVGIPIDSLNIPEVSQEQIAHVVGQILLTGAGKPLSREVEVQTEPVSSDLDISDSSIFDFSNFDTTINETPESEPQVVDRIGEVRVISRRTRKPSSSPKIESGTSPKKPRSTWETVCYNCGLTKLECIFAKRSLTYSGKDSKKIKADFNFRCKACHTYRYCNGKERGRFTEYCPRPNRHCPRTHN